MAINPRKRVKKTLRVTPLTYGFEYNIRQNGIWEINAKTRSLRA